MLLRLSLVFLFWVAPFVMWAQTLRGRLIDAQSNKPLAYGSIQAFPSGRATLADEQGEFKLQLANGDDTLQLRLLGYQALVIPLSLTDSVVTLRMQPQIWQLAEVTVTAQEDLALYALLGSCSNASDAMFTSRAYYELKSEVLGRQVELVEGFYNARLQGVELNDLKLKAGRLALQPIDRRLFANTETALALGEMPLFEKPKYLPGSPFGLTDSRLRKQYLLLEQGGYRLENGDSVVVVRFVPKRQQGAWFEGEAGIVVSTKQLHFVRLRCSKTEVHPFLPLSEGERLSNVHLELSRSMVGSPQGMRLEKLEMKYAVTYENQRGQAYPVSTRAILYFYAPNDPFFIPAIDFGQLDELSDYHHINAQPYLAAFWEHSLETRIEDVQGRNAAFFKDPRSITNVNLFTNQPLLGRGLIERPFTHWDGRRLIFNGITQRPPPVDPRKREVRVDDFHLEVVLYLDLHPLGDTLHWQTATIFDPYRSYFYLPMGAKEHCFVNIYFDLMELERRKLEVELLQSDRSVDSMKKLYEAAKWRTKQLSESYFRDTMLGNNRKGMESWNTSIKASLGIDNFSYFNLKE